MELESAEQMETSGYDFVLTAEWICNVMAWHSLRRYFASDTRCVRNAQKHTNPLLCPRGLNPPPSKLPSVQPCKLGNILVCTAFDLCVAGGQDYFNMARVPLIWINSTMCTIRSTTSFLRLRRQFGACILRRGGWTHRSLLNHNALNSEVFQLEIFGVGIGFSVLQQTQYEVDGLLRPAT